jgi:ABC-type multidrug transport system ATPase subunit
MKPIVQVTALSKKFGDFTAVDELSFAVYENDVYGFLGQNGAGKSTTIRMLLTLIAPSSGSIELFGYQLPGHRHQILQQCGAVIERPDLYKYLTAYEHLNIFAKMSGVKLKKAQLMEKLAIVGLTHAAHKKAGLYSQGMKQRLGIAIALVHDPRLIVLDEPTNGLDPQGIADMRTLIVNLSTQMNKTVIISSHLLSEVEQMATRMLIINKGKKIVEGRVNELLDPSHTLVSISAVNEAHACTVLQQSRWQPCVQIGKPLELMMNKEEVPALITHLVQQQVHVLQVNASHSLENYFLQLTNGITG